MQSNTTTTTKRTARTRKPSTMPVSKVQQKAKGAAVVHAGNAAQYKGLQVPAKAKVYRLAIQAPRGAASHATVKAGVLNSAPQGITYGTLKAQWVAAGVPANRLGLAWLVKHGFVAYAMPAQQG